MQFVCFFLALHSVYSRSTTDACCTRGIAKNDYWTKREQIIAAEEAQQIGSAIQLNDDELKANEILMGLKLAELDASFQDPGKYLPAIHFFESRDAISRNKIFAFLREMPKGGLLHTHDTATTNWDFLYAQTFKDNLYFCNDTMPRLRFFAKPDDSCKWELLNDMRREGGEEFEKYLVGHLTLIRENYNEEFSDINKVWSTFQNIFIFVTDMLIYKPVFEEQFYATLEQLYNDNVTYLEMRGTLPPVYNLEGYVYTPEEIVQIYVDVAASFKATHPEFIGVKLVYAPLRLVDNKTFEEYLDIARSIKTKFPDFVTGFDLVGQEDLGRPLVDYTELIQSLDMDFYFHAGETNWNQGLTDQNIIDAILLDTKRIGHGYALIKHPEMMKVVKDKQIAIEVSPISNQVLGLVRDLRNHPGSIYMATDMPMVITNDDPTYWGAEGVSYDWYMAFMGLSSRTADLKLLKQLAINSLKFSSLNDQEKTAAMTKWETQWNKFITKYILEHKKY